jgi:hypothetical protein
MPSHALPHLKPAPHYRVYIDETGSRFNDPRAEAQVGRIVAVVEGADPLPDLRTLVPSPRDFHAAHTEDTVNDRVFAALLARRVGVLGIRAGHAAVLPWGDPWLDALFSLLAWVARMVPRAHAPVHLEVFVEQRGPFAAGLDLTVAGRVLSQRLARVSPSLAADTRWSIQLTSADIVPELGWADEVAYTWGSTRPASVARLAASGLSPACLVDDEPGALAASFEPLFPAPLTPSWVGIFADPASTATGRLSARMLEESAEGLAQDPQRFAAVVDAACAALDARTLAPTPLLGVVDWLARHAPARLPAITQARWLDLRLAAASRGGHTANPELDAEYHTLHKRLTFEEPRLLAGIALRLSELALNAGDPPRARELLEPWSKEDPKVLGRLWLGRIESQLGRAALTDGRIDAASQRFSAALDRFKLLSDPNAARRERAQTANYLAQTQLERWLDGRAERSAATEAHTLALSLQADDVWRALLEARWAACTGESAPAHATVPIEVWPGPMVAAYRALALRDPQAMAAAIAAATSANSPALRWIGWGLGMASAAAGWAPAPLPPELPGSATSRITLAQASLTRGETPLATLRAALPATMR